MGKTLRRKPQEHHTEGRRMLAAYLESSDEHTQTSLAQVLEIGQSSISLWVNGRSRPEPHHRDALALLTRGAVPVESWLTDDERQKVARARAAMGA
jgi:DNA-binding transcriptional regulator YiaG